MNVVEIHLNQGELPNQMGAMRLWLDERGFESSGFSCRDHDHDGINVRLLFKAAHQAKAFAERFGGHAIDLERRPEVSSSRADFSACGIIG